MVEIILNEFDDPPKKKRAFRKRRVSSRNRVWHHPKRAMIEADLALGLSTTIISEKYGIASSILRKHRQKLTDAFKEKVRRSMNGMAEVDEIDDDPIQLSRSDHIKELVGVKAQIAIALQQAVASGNFSVASNLASTFTKMHDSQSRLLGFTESTPTVRVENTINNNHASTGQQLQNLDNLTVDELESLAGIIDKLDSPSSMKVIEHVR